MALLVTVGSAVVRKAGLGGSSAMHVVSPKSGDVLEHGSVCVLSAEEFGAHELVSVSIADARSWSGRWWREIEKTRAGFDGVVCVRWVVPKDLPVADAYVVRFAGSGGSACSSAGTAGTDDTKQPKPSSGKQSKSSSEKTTTREAEVSNVKVTSPLKLTRVGRDLVEIQWSPSALPTEQSGREGWRLAIDVLPVLRHDEYHPDVVGDLFLRAAFDGLTVHTRLKSVLYDVSKDEATRRRKTVKLVSDRTYRIALAGFTVGELEPVFSTSRADARMFLVQLGVCGGGYGSPNGGARVVSLGHAEFKRNVVATTKDAKDTIMDATKDATHSSKDTSGSPGTTPAVPAGDSTEVPSPSPTPKTPSAEIPTVDVNEIVPGLIPSSDDAAGDDSNDSYSEDVFVSSSPCTPNGNSPATRVGNALETLRQNSNENTSPAKTQPNDPQVACGAWEAHTGRNAGVFSTDRGINVVVVTACDLRVVFDQTWDTSGGRRAETARLNCASLRDAFTKGPLRVGSKTRTKWGTHFIAVTTSGAWAMARGKDGDDYGVGCALDAVLETLGATRATRVLSKQATRVIGQAPTGIAMLAACGPGGHERAAWAHFGNGPKDRAKVCLTLARGAERSGRAGERDGPGEDDEWFPALVRTGAGAGVELACGDWFVPWSNWGREPWGGVPAWCAESTKVERYLRLVDDPHARALFLGDAFGPSRMTSCKISSDDASAATSGSPGFSAVGPEAFDDGGFADGSDGTSSSGLKRPSRERVERGGWDGDGGDGSLSVGTGGGDLGDDDSKPTRNRVDVFGVTSALVEYATAKFVAANWCSRLDLRKKYRTMTSEELSLTLACERLVADIAAGGSAFAAAEAINAGACDFLAKRICSLVTAEGTFVGADAILRDAPDLKQRATEVRDLATAMARLLMRNGAACLAEAARRTPNLVEAVVRVFLLAWHSGLGLGQRVSVPEIEACVEVLADVNLGVVDIEMFGETRSNDAAFDGMGPGPADADETPFHAIRALKAGFARLPGPARLGSSDQFARAERGARVVSSGAGDGNFVRGRVCFLDVPAPDPKRPNAPLALPAASRFFSKRKTRPDCLPIQSGETETRPRDDDDETFVSSWQAGDDAETLRETDDTTDGAMDVDDSQVSSFPTGNTSHEPVSLVGAVAVFRGANGGWRAHELLIRQAPRLVLLAQAAGAVAAVFLWPDRANKYPPTQPLLASPNFATPTRIPAFAAPASAFGSLFSKQTETERIRLFGPSTLVSKKTKQWHARVRVGEPDQHEGSSVLIAARCGAVLVQAMSLRPSEHAMEAAHTASRGAGRVHGLHWLKRARSEREKRDAEAIKTKTERKDSSEKSNARKSTPEKFVIEKTQPPGTDRQTDDTDVVMDTGNETGWSWGGSLKYLGIKTGGSNGALGTMDTGGKEESLDGGENMDEGPVNIATASIDTSVERTQSYAALPSSTTRFSVAETAKSRRWSCATRVAYALGDLGKPLFDEAYPGLDGTGDPFGSDDTTGYTSRGGTGDDGEFDTVGNGGTPESARGGVKCGIGKPRVNTSPVRVLCLDGGGIRGLATIVMLRVIMERAQVWCVGEVFDLVVGTSTGGVIALGAGLLRLTLDEVGDLYDTMASEVFKPDGYYDLLRRGPGHAAAKAFEKVMGDMLGPEASAPLYAAAAHPRWFAASGKCRPGGPPRVCLVTSLVSRQPSTLVLLRSYHRNHTATTTLNNNSSSSDGNGELPGEHRMGAVDALRATTAAPWYMEELVLEKELGLGRMKREVSGDVFDDDGADVINGNTSDDGTHRDGFETRTKHHSCDDVSQDADARGAKAPRHRESLAPGAKTSARDASRVETTLRYIDGAIACNNPASVGIFEARRLFGKQRPLVVVSLGTGAAVPRETKTRSQDIGNVMGNLVNATCDVLQVDTLARHVLHDTDLYFRFQPVDDIFGCELNDSREVTRVALRDAAARYMSTETVDAEVEELAKALAHDG